MEKLTAGHLFHETIHSITHYEKGFLHTIWHFIIKPGTASINFIKGKRKEYQQPVGYILILTGIYILLHNFIINNYDYHYSLSNHSPQLIDFKEESNIFLRTHFTPFAFIILLASAWIIYLVMAGKIFNFIEILALCLYGGGTYFMMLTVSDIILGMIFKINIISVNVFIWQTLLSLLYNFWFTYDIFKKIHIKSFWPRMIFTGILISATGWMIMNYVPELWLSLFS
ncbi:MAG TPA: DUF3667 domain-containing protein [Chitinophagaceae bacterium]|nr:DUF3667 domain-containing protein [Chitinophagaceae bacterium]